MSDHPVEKSTGQQQGKEDKKVMVGAHMDEIGVIATYKKVDD